MGGGAHPSLVLEKVEGAWKGVNLDRGRPIAIISAVKKITTFDYFHFKALNLSLDCSDRGTLTLSSRPINIPKPL